MGQTLRLELPETVFHSLKQEAEKQGKEPEDLAADLLVKLVGSPTENDPLEGFFGAFDSNGLDWVENHDHYLASGGIHQGE